MNEIFKMKSLTSAYEDRIKSSESAAETDAAVLENAALLLEAVKESPGGEDFFNVLRYNQRLWTVLQVEITDAKIFPDQITANLLSLSIFVDKQTFRAMAEGSADRLNALINVNRQIAMGFREFPVKDDPPAEGEPPAPGGAPVSGNPPDGTSTTA